MKINCLVVDDEPMARKGMAEYIGEVEYLNLVAQCENPLKAALHLGDGKIDLIFLDIQMPKLTGIEFVKSLSHPPLIVFTTAFSEFALEGYSLDVVDYLVKPITFDRFLKATQKAYDILALRKKAALSGEEGQADHFFVKSDNRFEKVFFREVCYIEAMQNYVVIHTTSRKLIAYMTMSGIESQMPDDQFLKVHKSYIVGVAHIRSIDGSDIVIGQAHIPVSRNLKEDVMARILGNKLFKR